MHTHGPPAGPATPGHPRAALALAASRPWWRAACAPCWAAAHDRHTAARAELVNTALGASRLPQLHGQPMVADGGMETDLIFHHGVDLPHFAAFPLLESAGGRALLEDYYNGYASPSPGVLDMTLTLLP